jgi:hypothetical protein
VFKRLDAEDPAASFRRFIAGLGPGRSRPPLSFLHVSLPHVPWRFLPDGREYAGLRGYYAGLQGETWRGEQWLVDQAYQRHLLQTQYADRLVGQALDRLRKTGAYDDALIVVTADHGVSFHSGQSRRAPHAQNMADIANTPLFVKAPHQTDGTVDDRAVRSIDVLPTIAQLLGTALPWRVDGKPARARTVDPAARIDVTHQALWTTTAPLGRIVKLRGERDAQEQELTGGRTGPRAAYAIGPHPELTGRRVARMDVQRRGAEASATLDQRFRAPDAFVSGTVTGVPEGAAIVVAVDGRIEGTTRVRRMTDGTPVFAAMVDPATLTAGSAVAVYAVLPGGRLRALGGDARDAA